MKAGGFFFGICAVLLGTGAVHAEVTNIYEYPDRYVVEIDGSMDAKAATTGIPAAANSSSSSANETSLAVKASAPSGTESSVAPARDLITPKPYNRAEQVRAYLSKMPARSQAIEDRLERQQSRWSKLRSTAAVPSN